MLPKSSLVALCAIAASCVSSSLAGNWIGYMNVFNNDAGTKGGFVFGNGWGLADLKSTVTVSNADTYFGDVLVIQPNYNTFNASDPFWSDGLGNGNKFMEANTFVEFASIDSASISFQGTVNAYTLSQDYTALAFIKVLDPNNSYSLDVFETFDLASGSNFVVQADLTAHQGKLLQLGFMVSGLNANPINEATLGSVSVTVASSAIPEPSSYALLAGGMIALCAVARRRRRC